MKVKVRKKTEVYEPAKAADPLNDAIVPGVKPPEKSRKYKSKIDWLAKHADIFGWLYTYGPPIKPKINKKSLGMAIFMFLVGLYILLVLPLEPGPEKSGSMIVLVGLAMIGVGCVLCYIAFRDYGYAKEHYFQAYYQYYGIPYGEKEEMKK